MPAERHITNLIRAGKSPIQLLIPSTTDGGNLAIGASSARVDITDTFIVRVATDEDCYLNFGDDTVVAAAGDVLHAAGVETYAVPNGATHMAYIQSSAAGTMNWRNVAPGETIPAVPGGGGALSAPGVTGTIAHNETITISALGVEDFGTKPGSDKPKLVWRAEDNQAINANLILGQFDFDATSANHGVMVSSPTAANSDYSQQGDGGWNNDRMPQFPSFTFPADVDTIYCFRRRRANRGSEEGAVYRLKTTTTGEGVSAGNWARSRTAPNATGQVDGIKVDTTDTIFFKNDQGTIAKPRATAEDFGPGSVSTVIDFYATEAEANTGVGTILATVTESETSPTPFRTFNNKAFRVFPAATEVQKTYPNIFVSEPPTEGLGFNSANRSVEATPTNYFWNADTVNNQYWDNSDRDFFHNQEFLIIQNSALDADDGRFYCYKNGIMPTGNYLETYITRTTTYPNYFRRVWMDQNDNTFHRDTFFYYDYVYLDDSACRVVISDSATVPLRDDTNITPIETQVCPIDLWSPADVVCVVQQGEHADLLGKYIHVIDKNDAVVASRLISQ